MLSYSVHKFCDYVTGYFIFTQIHFLCVRTTCLIFCLKLVLSFLELLLLFFFATLIFVSTFKWFSCKPYILEFSFLFPSKGIRDFYLEIYHIFIAIIQDYLLYFQHFGRCIYTVWTSLLNFFLTHLFNEISTKPYVLTFAIGKRRNFAYFYFPHSFLFKYVYLEFQNILKLYSILNLTLF